MNGVFPLQQFPLRERTPMYVLLTGFLLVWIIMMFAASNKIDGVAVGIRFLLQLSFLLAAAIGAVQMKALARAREVIGTQPVPNALARTWVRACVVETSLAGAFLAACMGALLASPAAGAAWPVAVALLSSALCLGALCALGQYSMLPKALGWLANTVVLALLVALLYFRSSPLLAWFMHLPLPLLTALALSWPMLASMLTLRWRQHARASDRTPAAQRSRWQQAIADSIRRYSPLDPIWTRQLPDQQYTVRGRLIWAGRSVTYAIMCQNLLSPLHWGDRPDARHLLSLLVACLLMRDALVVHDLHWRALLMPGGWRTGRIASAIFKSTVRLIYVGVALAVAVGIVAANLLTNMPGEAMVAWVAGYVLVLAEIAVAVSAALVLRALPHSKVVCAAAVVIVLGVSLYCWAVIGYAHLWKAPPAGASYAVVLMAAAYGLVHLANRLWTNDKLMACARGSA